MTQGTISTLTGNYVHIQVKCPNMRAAGNPGRRLRVPGRRPDPSINDNDVKHRQGSLCKREVLWTAIPTQISKFATGKCKNLDKLHIKHNKKFRSSIKIN